MDKKEDIFNLSEKRKSVIMELKAVSGRLNILSNKVGKKANYENSRETNLIFKKVLNVISLIEKQDKEFIQRLKEGLCLGGYHQGRDFDNNCLVCREINKLSGDDLR